VLYGAIVGYYTLTKYNTIRNTMYDFSIIVSYVLSAVLRAFAVGSLYLLHQTARCRIPVSNRTELQSYHPQLGIHSDKCIGAVRRFCSPKEDFMGVDLGK